MKSLGRSFYIRDSKRGVMKSISEDEEFDVLDRDKDGEQIALLVFDGRAFITDEDVVPVYGTYIVIRTFNRTIDGQEISGQPEDQIRLGQRAACELMVDNVVKPKDPLAWSPREYKSDKVMTHKVKKMYDEEDGVKETVSNGDR